MVFCGHCKFYLEADRGSSANCEHRSNLRDTPTWPVSKNFLLPSVLNQTNDCVNFKPKFRNRFSYIKIGNTRKYMVL